MKTIKENNKILKAFNCIINVLSSKDKNIYSIVKVSGKGNWFEKFIGSDVLGIVMASTDYLIICKKVDGLKEEIKNKMKAKNGSK